MKNNASIPQLIPMICSAWSFFLTVTISSKIIILTCVGDKKFLCLNYSKKKISDDLMQRFDKRNRFHIYK